MKKLLLLFMLPVFIIACSKDDDSNNNPTQSDYDKVMAFLKEEGRFNTFIESVKISGLEEELKQGNITFIVPNDKAFAEYFKRTKNSASINITLEESRRIIRMSILKGIKTFQNSTNSYMETHQPAQLGKRNVSVFVGRTQEERTEVEVIKLMDAEVLMNDLDFGKYNLNELNQVVVPPTLADLIRVNPDYKQMYDMFINGLMSPDYLEMFLSNYQTTLFLPTDDAALAAMKLAGYSDYTSIPSEVLEESMNDNILQDQMYLDEINDYLDFDALSGRSNNIRFLGSSYLLDYGSDLNAEITMMDIQANNGTLNMITNVKMKLF